MTLRFDPEGIERFKSEIRGIPGYPAGEDLPIREMVFESGALWRLPELLSVAGMKADQPLSVVMDRTSMQREGADLKSLILEQLGDHLGICQVATHESKRAVRSQLIEACFLEANVVVWIDVVESYDLVTAL